MESEIFLRTGLDVQARRTARRANQRMKNAKHLRKGTKATKQSRPHQAETVWIASLTLAMTPEVGRTSFSDRRLLWLKHIMEDGAKPRDTSAVQCFTMFRN
jgi:hypothetical protein